MKNEPLDVTPGNGNVYQDLGKEDADVRQFKPLLAAEIIRPLHPHRVGELSRIRNADLGCFTLDRLVGILNRLGSHINPDISAFAAHGGKLLMWVGWEDPQIFVWDTVNFFEYMVRQNAANATDGKLIGINYENPEYPYGNMDLAFANPAIRSYYSAASQAAHDRAVAATNQFAKLYMASGVDHCGGGPGAQSFVQNANYGELTQGLVNWVENGVAPGDITITKRADNSATGAVQFTTLLCSYPKSLTYLGSGDLLSASSYVCQWQTWC